MTSTQLPFTRGPSKAARRTPRRKPRINSAYLFILPSVLLIGVFIAEPIVQSGWMSLHDWTVGEAHHKFVGLDNYTTLYHDSRFWNALRVTVVYTAAVAVGQVAIALAIASRLRRTTWYSALLRTAYFFPFIASLVVSGIVWKFLLDPQVGLVDAWLTDLGFSAPNWLQSTSLALPTVIAVGIWKNVGFTMIILLAGMQQIPPHLYEAAALDGAGPWQRFRHVTLPALRPALLFTTLIATVTGLQLFDLVFAMTSGGPIFHTESVVMYLYQKGFVEFQMGYASAVAWVLFVIILAISALQLRLSRFRDAD
ncbi:carbohydrate ABC transporter permease [Actinacidiphila alni]|uniref:Carbohydrate ABC transporter membrane protein 1, CUT1 family n=1 Tax=Actinacidiphila alni TaxID=380248 RepID=A0A1I2ME37_9ACTN|nr:sugar ABC transporter permease [Actinacidiphila alni]SFF89723.1 carbohydrate ABC transporter membrane protein 1, CUT1 family [Actinacidiphila alni]